MSTSVAAPTGANGVKAASRGTCAAGCMCGCCSGAEAAVPESLVNAPGLSALAYRAGRYATFFETMVARLGRLTIEVPSPAGSGTDTLRPLRALTTRDASDPSIALLDAWAVVADVLCFYQERIANEGYLPTAIEQRSLMALSRLVGYRPRPGVAASVRLAFTVAAGFSGVLPAGTRAQSVSPGGSPPQFYETSADLVADALWNSLAPRLTRAQLITPAMEADDWPPGGAGNAKITDAGDVKLPADSGILVTGAEVIDSVYLNGIATQIKPGDAVFFIFGADTATEPPLQYLRIAAEVAAQPDFLRTQVALGLEVPADRTALRQILLYIDKGKQLFPGNELVADVVALLGDAAANLVFAGARSNPKSTTPLTARQIVEAAMSRVTIQRGIAIERGFTRVAAYLAMLIRSFQWIGLGRNSRVLPSNGGDGEFESGEAGLVTSLRPLPASTSVSALEHLSSIVQSLAKPPSVQPANALRLARSVAKSFGPQSDLAPRLLSVLHPAAKQNLYAAWSTVGAAAGRVEVYAARLKLTLFAANWAGVAVTTRGVTVTTTYTPPLISSAWGEVPSSGLLPIELPLDGVYDQIKPGSWVAVRRPAVQDVGDATTSFHVVVSTRSSGLSTRGGFAAKVTLLTLDPPWLSELEPVPLRVAVGSTEMLRQTTVFAQSDLLSLADEPVDADVEKDAIDLAQLVEGLEPGRCVIVSGRRTDIPNAAGVTSSELAMIAGVRQGVEAPGSTPFPSLPSPPFASFLYVTDADAYGDRLVVGRLPPELLAKPSDTGPALFSALAPPAFVNQQYADQIQIAPGRFANAYVPTLAERAGRFPSFDGLLVDPQTQLPYPGGELNWQFDGVFAWRVTAQKPHTVLELAAPLAFTYDRGSVTIYGNVADATHGQSTGEVLGDGDARLDFASFPLGQAPLTYVSSSTPSGAASTLAVRVNELQWHEIDDPGEAAPLQRAFVTRQDESQKTTVTFGNGTHGARLPTGTANVKATYRYGIGSAGNAATWVISQLATHPLGAQAVTNPLPATGGADADRPEQIRANTPMAVMALDRLVSVSDYADFARTYAGIGKAASVKLSDGRSTLVHVTVAGADDIPIDPSSDLYANLRQSLVTFGDPFLEVQLSVRRLRLLVIAATVALEADCAWEDVEPALRAALLARFSFAARALGQSAYLSEAIGVAQSVAGVAWVNFTHFDSVGESIDAPQLAALAGTLGLNQFVASQLAQFDPATPGAISPAELVLLTPDIPAMLTLTPMTGR